MTEENLKLYTLLESSFKDFNPAEVPKHTNFWLVRAKRGHFYDTFLLKNFIALGWNLIDQNSLSSFDEKTLKDQILHYYTDNSRPGYPLNQSRTFVEEMNPGDFVVVPAYDKKPVMFGQLVEYYEENNLTYADEISFLQNMPPTGESAECPYKKRWKVNWIKSRYPEELNPYLNKLFTSSHGISKANIYSDYILSSIFDFYKWDNTYNGVFHVKQEQRIRSRALSGFIYNMDKLAEISIGVETSVKNNLNSPGDIILSIGDMLTNLENAKYFYLVAFFLASNINFGPFTLKGLLPCISSLMNRLKNDDLKTAEVEKKRADTEKAYSEARYFDAKADREYAEAAKTRAETERIKYNIQLGKKLEDALQECQECAKQLEIEPNAQLISVINKFMKDENLV